MDPPGPGSKPKPEPGLSSVSLRSDSSKEFAIYFRTAEDQSMDPSGHGPGSKSRPKPASRTVSIQSDCSKEYPPDFGEPHPDTSMASSGRGPRSKPRPKPGPSTVSLKSDRSKEYPPEFSEPRPVMRECDEKERVDAALKDKWKITHGDSVGDCTDELKTHLRHRFSCVFEGVDKSVNPAPLQQIYTELYIVEGETSEVNQEHEVRHMESMSRKPVAPETTIRCEDIFRGSVLKPEETTSELKDKKPLRTVLTEGVAGIGKTVLTQKFTLDWAEDRANQDIQLLFPFTFRELNVLSQRQFSLVELVHHFFSQTKRLHSFEDLQVLFILDGLDECRFSLDFSRTRVITEPKEQASLEELLVNLIRGNLLPSAHIWITTRPAAANQIPVECVSMVTEVQGFTDSQKELYFMKRIINEQQATDIITHIKKIRSLHIMCYIPVFCWMLSTVLLHLLKTKVIRELPKTLTQMYIHFLVVQAKIKNIKFDGGSGEDLHWTPETKKMVWSLGKLAFEQVLKGNLIFYDCDVRESGLNPEEIARYSGVFTEIFREESGLYKDKIYCFIHLTVQECLAALHVHQTYFTTGVNLLSTEQFSDSEEELQSPSHSFQSPEAFYRSAVDMALQSPNGHLDLFLRFLLGLSLPTNQSLLQGLLTPMESDSKTHLETAKYIEQKLDEKNLSAERSMNLLHCLNELNDSSLIESIQKYLKHGCLAKMSFHAQWSALSFLLLSSGSDLEEFDLRKYRATERALLGLLPVIKASTKAILCCCDLSYGSCDRLSSILSSSSLTLLDLSNNDLKDSGVENLCSGLKSIGCRLETLRLSGCLVSEKGGASLASALSSAHSSLKELDLSYNHPGSSSESLNALRDDPRSPLDSLRLDPAGEQWMIPGLKKYSCQFCLDSNTAQRNLRLSEDRKTVTHGKKRQRYPNHEDRFTDLPQVLSSTGLKGRCYWEVEWNGKFVEIAVTHRDIRRKGDSDESMFGNNDLSWSLRIREGKFSACHLKNETPVSFCTLLTSGKVGILLDSVVGELSFYHVHPDGGLLHLHTIFNTFSEPLFPGFGVRENSSVSVVDLKTNDSF